jgi:hypothetical protein
MHHRELGLPRQTRGRQQAAGRRRGRLTESPGRAHTRLDAARGHVHRCGTRQGRQGAADAALGPAASAGGAAHIAMRAGATGRGAGGLWAAQRTGRAADRVRTREALLDVVALADRGNWGRAGGAGGGWVWRGIPGGGPRPSRDARRCRSTR